MPLWSGPDDEMYSDGEELEDCGRGKFSVLRSTTCFENYAVRETTNGIWKGLAVAPSFFNAWLPAQSLPHCARRSLLPDSSSVVAAFDSRNW